MYVIETELGRFEAENEKDAKKLLKKAEKEHHERELVRTEHYRQANYKAQSKACRMMYDFITQRRGCCPWILEPDDDFYKRYVRKDDWKLHLRADDFDGAPECTYTESYKVLAVSILCDGSVQAVWLQYDNETPCGYAVGYHEQEMSLENLPEAMTIEWAKGEATEPAIA
jgi:hypothetical protein